MLNSLLKLFKFLEKWEYSHSSSFWLFIIGVYFGITIWSSHALSPVENQRQTQTVVEQVRCGGSEKPCSDQQPRKVTNFTDDLAKKEYLKKMLVKHFPDFESRLSTEKWQAIIYQKAIKKIKEYKRISPLLKNYQKNLTIEENSAINYFHGTGIYAKFQDPKTPPNINDTRKTFLWILIETL